MKGTYHIIVQNNRIRYEFDIRRNLTMIRGDSATGKTQLISMIETHQQMGISSGIDLQCEVSCVVLNAFQWQTQLASIHHCIVFIEEGQKFVSSNEFAECVRDSDNYYVIISRHPLSNLPYSVTEIYGIRESGKYAGLRQTYNELYQIYGTVRSDANMVGEVLAEDSNAGYEFYQSAVRSGIECKSAGGKSNIPQYLSKTEEKSVLVIADGAAFGPEMEAVHRRTESGQKVLLYLPESFEWLILSSSLFNRTHIREILADPSSHLESRQYFSWERYFTALLSSETKDSYMQYSKSRLNDFYLHKNSMEKIIAAMPAAIQTIMKAIDE